ncbi:hypothetical protein ACST14_04420 [Aquirufa sp. A-Brett2-15D]
MKTSKFCFLALSIVISGFIFSSCSSSVPLAKVQDSREIKFPFSEKEFKSNNEFMRIVAHGESASSTMAEKIAMQNAQTSMANRIKTVVQVVTREFSKQYSKSDVNESYESMDISVSNETLSMINVLDKKILLQPGNIYDIWVVVEISKKSILESANKAISSGKKAQIDADRDKFREIFESEMNKIDR